MVHVAPRTARTAARPHGSSAAKRSAPTARAARCSHGIRMGARLPRRAAPRRAHLACAPMCLQADHLFMRPMPNLMNGESQVSA